MDYKTSPSEYQRIFNADQRRYDNVKVRHVGKSGLKINEISIGTWQNFSALDALEDVRNLYLTAFDNGIFSFDFGNNYGRPPGSSEEIFGQFLSRELLPYRRELVISTKAGYDMWPGPNGEGSSLKYLISSLDDSLERMKIDYVDIFYSHRYDPQTPIEETAEALDLAKRSGRCLYVGISSYPPKAALAIAKELNSKGTPCLINQSHYNIFSRDVETDIFNICRKEGIGFAAFSPLAQGLLSNKNLGGKRGGRSAKTNSSVFVNDWDELSDALFELDQISKNYNMNISQLAIGWVLRREEVCTAVIGVSNVDQIVSALSYYSNISDSDLKKINSICSNVDVNLWKLPEVK